MNMDTAIRKMCAPGARKPGKYLQGVIQVWVTRACDKSCYGCTQGSNLAGKPGMITVEQFEQAVASLKDYFGVVGVFGGNPALHPRFDDLCEVMQRHIPYRRRGLWCNHPRGKGKTMAETFNPAVSNLNVHMDRDAYDEFKRDWPASRPVGLTTDSRHSPPFVAIKDVVHDEQKMWETISTCDINRHWSAMVCVVRGELQAYFCEVAGAQAMLHENDPSWPVHGVPVVGNWWKQPLQSFRDQVGFHCPRCGVPLRGYGELAVQGTGPEQVSETHADVYVPKRRCRDVELVSDLVQLDSKGLKFTHYIQGASK